MRGEGERLLQKNKFKLKQIGLYTKAGFLSIILGILSFIGEIFLNIQDESVYNIAKIFIVIGIGGIFSDVFMSHINESNKKTS